MVFEGDLGLGGIDYLLQCIVETDEDAATIQWQGLLGRLYMLEQLIKERSGDFIATARVDGSAAANVTTEPHDCYTRTFIVLRFIAQHISFPHAKAAKLAIRVFCQAAVLQVAVGGMAVVDEACRLLDTANSQIQWRIRRKLQSAAGDYVRDKVRRSLDPMKPSAIVDPVVFFVSAQPAPQMEIMPESSHDADTATASETTSQQLQSVVCSTDNEPGHTVDTMSPTEKRFVYDTAVVVSKQATMTDAYVQTSPLLLRRGKMMTAASSVDDGSDIEFGSSRQTMGPFGLHASGSTALLDSHGSASGSHGSTSGMTDDFTDFAQTPQSADEKVSFRKEVALDSLEQKEGRQCAVSLLIS